MGIHTYIVFLVLPVFTSVLDNVWHPRDLQRKSPNKDAHMHCLQVIGKQTFSWSDLRLSSNALSCSSLICLHSERLCLDCYYVKGVCICSIMIAIMIIMYT